MGDAGERPRLLVQELSESGDLTPEWRDTFLAVPRHAFIPDTVWLDDGAALRPFRKPDDPGAWLDICYANRFVVTQVDDGDPAGLGHEITSSASRPDVVALMLTALRAEPGMTVLEIGTGTGYNAALLAERLGAANVTTLEVDPVIADHARRALRRAGYDVAVITGDGGLGHPARAPYDRVIATVGVQRVPYAWIAQTRPGGRVLVPWATDFHNGALIAFTVGDDASATGRIVGNVAFMLLRDQRGKRASLGRDVKNAEQARRTVTERHPYDVIGEYDASLAIGIKVPRCKTIVESHDEADAYTVWLIDPWSGSWASLHRRPGIDRFDVSQYGPRGLWDEVVNAHRWWARLGKPGADRWGFTVTRDAQRIWLDSPENLLATNH